MAVPHGARGMQDAPAYSRIRSLERLQRTAPADDGIAEQYTARCPSHDDNRSSLSVAVHRDGHILLHCHTGCEPAQIASALGCEMRDLFPPKEQPKPTKPTGKPRIVETYDYTDEEGTLLFQAVRYDPKDFKQRQPNGSGGWNWNLKGVRRVPYRLVALRAADPHAVVYLVEGEKDAKRLAVLGLVATTTAMGASNLKHSATELAKALSGRRVVIVHDLDDAGDVYAADGVKVLRGVASELGVVRLPRMEHVAKHGEDVSDWLDRHDGTLDELKALAAAALARGVGAPADNIIDFQEARANGLGSDSGEPSKRVKPIIIGKHRQLDQLTAETLAALYAANSPEPFIFRRNKTLARVRRDEHGQPMIEEMTKPILRSILADVADFGFYRPNGKDDTGEKCFEVADMSPPDDLVDNILAQADWQFPTLDGLIEAPALRPDGTIITKPGYDAATRLVYLPDASLTVDAIPERPTTADVQAALATLEDLLADFPFDSPASKAHAYALLLTGVVRPAIQGKVPLAVTTAPAAGTGKGLLNSLVPLIATGREPMLMTACSTDEEWGKLITSTLMAAPSFILVDNIRGKLDSAKLDAAITADFWQDRVLGANKIAALRQRAVWMATGNNLMLGGDLPRRVYRIRLDAEMARPERREGFRHPDLTAYVRTHRSTLLMALLTIARNWYASGKPAAKVTPMGSFEAWSQTIGSMLAHIGVPGFLANLDEMYAESDTERPQWAAFFTAWYEAFPNHAVTANHVASTIHAAVISGTATNLVEALPEVLTASMTNLGLLGKRIAYNLRHLERVRYELDDGSQVYVKKAGQNRVKTALWQVIRVPGPRDGGHDGADKMAAHAANSPQSAGDQKPSPAAQTRMNSGLGRDVQVIAGDDSNSYMRKKIDDIENVCVDGSRGHHQQSPAQVAPAQTASGAGPAGDQNASPAPSPAPAPVSRRSFEDRVRAYVDAGMAEQAAISRVIAENDAQRAKAGA